MPDYPSFQPSNPLDTIGKAIGIQNALTQNRLTNQQILNAQQELQNMQTSNEQGKQKLGTDRNVQTAKQLAQWGMLPDDQLNGSVVLKGLSDGVKTGAFSQETANFWAQRIQPGMTAAQLRPLIQSALVGTMSGPEAMQQLFGSNANVNLGNEQVQGTVQSPAKGGGFTPNSTLQNGFSPGFVGTGGGNVPTLNGQPAGPAIPNTPTPAEQNQLVQVWDEASKQFKLVPRNQVPGAPLVGGSGQPAPGQANGPFGTGRLPSALLNPNRTPTPQASGAPAAQPVPQVGSAPPYQAAAGPALGTAEEANASVAHLADARAAANTYSQRINPLNQAESLLQRPEAATGVGQDWITNAKAWIGRLTPGSWTPFAESTDTNNELQKYFNQTAINAPGGARSNQGQEAASAANPNIHLSKDAALALTRTALATERMTQAGTIAFNKSGLPASAYDKFMNDWNTKQDIRAYAADKLSQKERKDMVSHMTAAQWARYKASYDNATQNGVFDQ